MPKGYLDKPVLYDHLFYILNAFNELDSDRNYLPISSNNGTIMTPCPISFNSIVQYANIYGYMDDFESFLYLLRAIDNKYIELRMDKVKNG